MMKNDLKKISKKTMPATRQGFSFVEIIFAIFILSVPLIVFMEVIVKSMGHSMESRDTIIAAGLAQEGVELVKNIRDNNWVQKEAVFNGLGASPCVVNYNDSDLCDPSGDYKLKFDGNFYNHNSGSTTEFSRKINIRTEVDTRVITSYVIWSRPWSGSGFSDPAPDNCNPAHKCVYASVILTKWGGE